MDVVGICEYCGSSQKSDSCSCECCGASITYNEMSPSSAAAPDKTNSPVHQGSGKSLVYFTGTTILFAVLVGIFWQVSQIADQQQHAAITQESATLSSIIGTNAGYRKKAILASALADISILKTMVHQHHAISGEFPNTLSDLRVNADEMVSRNIRKVSIEKDGVVLALLTKDLGSGIELKLIPKLAMGGNSIDWSCASNLPSSVLHGSPCEAS